MTHVLELSPETLGVLSGDVLFERTTAGDSKLLAFATYLHETVHWWQHTGTTAGLVSALTRAAQAHVLSRALKSVRPDDGGPVKPAYVACQRPDQPATVYEELAVNGWMDIEFGSVLLSTPEAARPVVQDPFFESVGQSYLAYMSDALGLIRATIGGAPLIADFWRGYGSFEALIEAGVEGYAPDASRVTLPLLGLRAIQEGQARFTELQFRYLASRGRRESWAEFAAQGLLGQEYVRAFEIFFTTTGLARPESPIAPEVNLFLLVCDLAMMPSAGYPEEIVDFTGFIEGVSPGARFLDLCRAIRRLGERGALLGDLTQPNASTYREVSARLCSSLQWFSPAQIAEKISGWVGHDLDAERVMNHALMGRVQDTNASVAYFYGRHLATMMDRVARPDFFCWPAYSFVSSAGASFAETEALMRRNAAPFVRNGEFGGIGVTPHLGIDKDVADKLSSHYFGFQMIYDLGSQWIAAPGHFDFDFAWADPRWSAVQYREWLAPAFERFYGHSLDSVSLVGM